MPKPIARPPRPKAGYPPPETPEEFMRDIHRRIVRMETRQGRILEHLGLDTQGNPVVRTNA